MSVDSSFFRKHVIVIPGALAIAGMISMNTGIDHALTAAFYDAATHRFPAHASVPLELFGHRFAKTAVTMLWLALVAMAASTHFWPRWRPYLTENRAAMWLTVLGMALGPIVVVTLKGLNAYHCPWDLHEFGGGAAFTTGWFVPASEVGHCFPGGHASSGFCLIALFFLGCEMESPRFARFALLLAVFAGTSFSLIRMAQGAHFLSHNLWAAAICWSVSALAFLPLHMRRLRMGTVAA